MFVPPQGVWFLRRFGLKIGYRFFFLLSLESGTVFKGITGLYLLFQFQINKK